MNISDVTTSSITIQWGVVDCIHRNGNITGYSVEYGVQGSGSTQTVSVSGGGSTRTIISGLTPSTNYSIKVAAENSVDTEVYVYSNNIFQLTQGTCTHKLRAKIFSSIYLFTSLPLQFKPPSCQLIQQQPIPSPSPGLVLAQWWIAMR